MDVLLLRYGELFLKGRNRPTFERQLRQNIEALSGRKVYSTRGRLMMNYFPEHQQLQRVFGLTSYSPAFKREKDIEQIKATALKIAGQFSGTFKVETTRSDKTFPWTSIHLNTLLGKHIEQGTSLQADYRNPQHTLFLEINQAGAFLYTEIIPGAGGLPVGSSGLVSLLVEDDASLLAGLLMMKRGCTIIPLRVGKGRAGKEPVGKEPDLSLLQQFSPKALSAKVMKDRVELPAFIEQLIGQQAVLVTGEALGKKLAKKKKLEGKEKKSEIQERVLTLKPLVAYSAEEIRTRLKRFRELTV